LLSQSQDSAYNFSSLIPFNQGESMKRSFLVFAITGAMIGGGIAIAQSAQATTYNSVEFIGSTLGGAIGGVLGATLSGGNPFVVGGTGAAGAYLGTVIGPVAVDHPKETLIVLGIAASGPMGILTFGVNRLTSFGFNYIKTLF
jgi:hypothetical protein